MERMKVLIQNPYMKAGGAENRIQLLIEALVARPDIEQVHFMFTGEQSHHTEQADGKLHFWQINPIDTKKTTAKILKEYDIDVVQFHNALTMRLDGLELAQKLGLPTVWVMHDFWVLCPQLFFTRVWKAMDYPLCTKFDRVECTKCVGEYPYLETERKRKIINNCDVGIVPSNRIAQIFYDNGVLQDKMKVVLPWVKFDLFDNDPNVNRNPWQVMFAGNFIPHKGIRVLLRAWDLVQRRLPMARLVAQGDMRCLSETIQLKNNLGLDTVQLINRIPQKELKNLYNSSALCAFPSIWEETIGLIWVEALACGTPAVCSETGSIPELLKYGGVMFPPRDHVKLAENIVDLLLSPRKRTKLATEGYNYVRKNFTKERAADDFTKLYYKLEVKI